VVNAAIEKRKPGALKEKAQYGTAFGLIAVMLWVAGFPVFLLFFVGILTFFIWKVFSAEGRTETRRIFEFYLSANEILREDDRRWYGFEIQETIGVGEQVVRSMPAAPPLVHFTLGALYQKLGDHSSALSQLSRVVDDGAAKESAIVYPTRELREYVKMLRRIERNPAEAPMTSSAIRSLERLRRTRGGKIIEASRIELSRQAPTLPETADGHPSVPVSYFVNETEYVEASRPAPASFAADRQSTRNGSVSAESSQKERKTISEVLHDIYDGNVQ
jgi:hypothetical protein